MEHLNLDPQSYSDPSKIPSQPSSPSSSQPIQRYSTSSTDSRASISSTTPSLSEEVHVIDQFTKAIFNQMHTLTPAQEKDDLNETLHRARFSFSSSDHQEEVSKLSTSSDIETDSTDGPSLTRHEYDVEEGDEEPSITTSNEYEYHGEEGEGDEPSVTLTRQEYSIEQGDEDFEPSVLEEGSKFAIHEPPPPPVADTAAADVSPDVSLEKSPKEKDSIFKSLINLFKP